MTVLGIDPGSRVTGWGVLVRERGRYRRIASGAVSGAKDATLAERLVAIHRELARVIAAYKPDEAAVEAIFHHRSSESALKLGHARGVVLLSLAEAGVPIFEYSTTHIKKAVTGYGQADKEQIQRVVAMLLGEAVEGPADVADAIAVAITHLAQARALTAGGAR
ncbi:MAG: crossover junction endodeoxyribonuclease RuvC [Pseudomonadota bacterium]